MVTFKTLKYKHYEQSKEFSRQIDAKEVDEAELTKFVMDLVQSWDYLDEETKKPIEPGKPGELSLEQYQACMKEFNEQMSSKFDGVKKTNNGRSLSGLTDSKKGGKPKPSRQSGLIRS